MSKKIILGLVIVLVLSFCATGIVGATIYEETQSSLREGNLFYGMRSGEVKELQQRLSEDISIYPEKLITGYFGLLTQKAVKRFQASQGLSQTGTVDQSTWNAILQPTIGKIGDIDNPTDTDTNVIAKISCDEVCKSRTNWLERRKYDYGTCRNACHAGEVNLGATSDCNYCPPGVACAAVMSYCCCGNNATGYIPPPIFRCTDSDGGIMKYVKGTTCQPSELSISSTGNVVGSEEKPEMARLFCKTDYCMTVKTPGGGTYLKEYYCANGVMMSKTIKCENGCADGACIENVSEYGKPYCNMEGSRSEGWYHQKEAVDGYRRQELIRWDNCDGCLAVCKAIGSRSEGWYSSCDDRLIKYANCEEPTLTVLSPNGGERLVEGGTYKITWKLNEPAISSIDKIGIYLVDYSRDGTECSSQGCVPWKRAIAWDLPAYPSEYLWSTSAPFWGGSAPFLEEQYELMQDKSMKLGDKYKIRIGKMANLQMDIGFGDESDNYFSIVKKGDVSCRDENYPCTIDDIPCCSGLKEVGYCFPEGGSCICATCGSICRPCGNGVCDANENKCSCPEDCKTTTPPVDVQPVINMIKQAIEKLNSAIRLLGDLI